MTTFQLLTRYDETPGWAEWQVVEAHNAEAAINKAYLAKPDGKIVAVVAVPARSWKPKVIRAENVIRVRFGTDENESTKDAS